MAPPGLAAVEAAKRDGSWTFLDDVEAGTVPDDLEAALDANPKAAANNGSRTLCVPRRAPSALRE